MADLSTVSTQISDSSLEKALVQASQGAPTERLVADSESRPACGQTASDDAVAPAEAPVTPELAIAANRPKGSSEEGPSLLRGLEAGQISPELAQLFKWLPAGPLILNRLKESIIWFMTAVCLAQLPVSSKIGMYRRRTFRSSFTAPGPAHTQLAVINQRVDDMKKLLQDNPQMEAGAREEINHRMTNYSDMAQLV